MPSSGTNRPWQMRQHGRAVELHPPASIQVNDGEGMGAAACMSLGLVQVPDYMVRDEIADGRLVEVLPECRPASMPISAVYPGARLGPARVRALLEIVDSLQNEIWPPAAWAGRPATRGVPAGSGDGVGNATHYHSKPADSANPRRDPRR